MTQIPRHGVARAISKMGLGSRTQAANWVIAGRVRVNDTVVRDPEFPVRLGIDRVQLDGQESAAAPRLVVMLNKPRGLVTSADDEQGRATVYQCLEGYGLPWLAPVGRLDKASEGLLLFSNDPTWAARITSPTSGPDKSYHVQINRLPDAELLATLVGGMPVDGTYLAAKHAAVLRTGDRNAWLELVLDEGRNRHIRRLLTALEIKVLRLVRVSIGSLRLGNLAKGQWRALRAEEIEDLTPGLLPPPSPGAGPAAR